MAKSLLNRARARCYEVFDGRVDWSHVLDDLGAHDGTVTLEEGCACAIGLDPEFSKWDFIRQKLIPYFDKPEQKIPAPSEANNSFDGAGVFMPSAAAIHETFFPAGKNVHLAEIEFYEKKEILEHPRRYRGLKGHDYWEKQKAAVVLNRSVNRLIRNDDEFFREWFAWTVRYDEGTKKRYKNYLGRLTFFLLLMHAAREKFAGDVSITKFIQSAGRVRVRFVEFRKFAEGYTEKQRKRMSAEGDKVFPKILKLSDRIYWLGDSRNNQRRMTQKSVANRKDKKQAIDEQIINEAVKMKLAQEKWNKKKIAKKIFPTFRSKGMTLSTLLGKMNGYFKKYQQQKENSKLK